MSRFIRSFTKVALPPLIPLLPFVALAAYLVYDQSQSPFDRNGRPDDAPGRAALLMLFLSPVAYTALLVAHSVCLALQRWLSSSLPRAYLFLVLGCAVVISSFSISRGGQIVSSIAYGILASAVLLFPMLLGDWAITRYMKTA
jgi:hypothetical protein